MSNKVFDTLRFLSEVLLAALGTLYFALSQIWGLPYGEEVVGTLAAIAAFLGVFVDWKRKKYARNNEEEQVSEE